MQVVLAGAELSQHEADSERRGPISDRAQRAAQAQGPVHRQPRRAAGAVHAVCDAQSEAETIAARIAAEIGAGRAPPRDFAIFYRVDCVSRTLEFALRDQGIPYQIVNGLEFFQRREIKDVLAYLLLLNNPRDDVALLRVINTPPRGIGRTTIERHRPARPAAAQDHAGSGGESGLIEDLSKKKAVDVARFVAMIDRLTALATGPVEEILGHVLAETGYRDHLMNSESEEDQERLANIEELLTAARQFDERHAGNATWGNFSRNRAWRATPMPGTQKSTGSR